MQEKQSTRWLRSLTLFILSSAAAAATDLGSFPRFASSNPSPNIRPGDINGGDNVAEPAPWFVLGPAVDDEEMGCGVGAEPRTWPWPCGLEVDFLDAFGADGSEKQLPMVRGGQANG